MHPIRKYFLYTSLKQINMLAILIVLLFTVVFSALLIQEEYKLFEKLVVKEKSEYLNSQKEKLLNIVSQVKALANDELTFSFILSEDELDHLASLFTRPQKQFVYILMPKKEQTLSKIGEEELLRKLDLSKTGISAYETEEGKKVLISINVLNRGYILVAGLYGQSAEALFIKRQTEMKSRLIRIILEITTLAFILFGFIFGVSKINNATLEKDVNAFLKFFSNAAHNDKLMDPEDTFFQEFKSMVFYANKMVLTSISQKHSLQVLNMSLEDKVKEKTEDLEVKNSALQKAKQYSQDLLTAQKNFIRYAIHETNTPLSVIMANIELFEISHGKSPHLSKIEAAMKNVFVIFDDLSYLVKKDHVSYPKHTIELVDYIRSRIEFFEEIALQAHLSFEFHSELKSCELYFNEMKLQRIVDNNLSNAIKYTPKDEKIKVSLSQKDNQAVLSICSRSQQIQQPEKVFDAFYRESKYQEGFGLGLNLVKGVCTEEDVEIDLVSDAQRTCFSYTFKGEKNENTLA